MNLFLNRHSAVPLHDQLCAQIGQLIASGSLTEGARLPSVRSLATRLGIHHNTVQSAYKELAERGVVHVRQGSGVRVAPLAHWEPSAMQASSLDALAAQFVAHAQALGYDAASIQAACRQALAPARITRLVVVNPHPDLQRLYLHEFSDRLALPMAGMTLEAIPSLPESQLAETCFVTSMNHAGALRTAIGDKGKLVIYRLASVEPLLAQVRDLPSDAVVVLVSESERFLFLIGELLSGVLPTDRLITVPLSEADRVRTVTRLASLVVTDSGSAGRLALVGNVPVQVFRVLADDVFTELQGMLPADAFSPC